MKAAQYFDSAAGFGEWRLLMSTRGIQDLRDAHRNNPETFRIIVKKMKFVLFKLAQCRNLAEILMAFSCAIAGNFPTDTSRMTTRRG